MISKVEYVFTIAVLALLGLSSPCGAEDLSLAARIEGAPAMGPLADISLAAFGGALGLVADGYLRDNLVFGLELGYDAYPSDLYWVQSLAQASAFLWGGWRFPLGGGFGMTPRAGLGMGYAFGSAAFSAGNIEPLSALQFLARAGATADYALSRTLSLQASMDLRLTVESGGAYTGLALGAGVSWRLPRVPERAKEARPARIEPAAIIPEASVEPGIAPTPSLALIETLPEPELIAEPAPAAVEAPMEEPKVEPAVEMTRVTEALAADLTAFPSIRVASGERGVRIVLEGTFEPDSATLTEETRRQLEAVAVAADALRPVKVIIRGYTARDGRDETDGPVSEARAEAVRLWMADNDCFIGADTSTAAMGSADPAGDNDTAEGRARNRRVEIEIVMYPDAKE